MSTSKGIIELNQKKNEVHKTFSLELRQFLKFIEYIKRDEKIKRGKGKKKKSERKVCVRVCVCVCVYADLNSRKNIKKLHRNKKSASNELKIFLNFNKCKSKTKR